MSKNKIKKEEISDFDDLKELLLKNLSPQSQNQDEDSNNIDYNDKSLGEDNSYSKEKGNTYSENELYRKSNARSLATRKEKKQEEINDFDDLKDLLLKNLSQQNPQNNEGIINAKKDSQVDDPFLKDANEGLQLVHDKAGIDKSVHSMNNNLNKILDSRKQRKKKHTIPTNQWALLAVGVVLLLAILAYFVIHLNGVK